VVTSTAGTLITVNGGTLRIDAQDGLGQLRNNINLTNGGTLLVNLALPVTGNTGSEFGQQISSINTDASSTIALGDGDLLIGNKSDAGGGLNSTVAGLITSAADFGAGFANFAGQNSSHRGLGKTGLGTLTITNPGNSQLVTNIICGTINVGVASTLDGTAFTAGSTVPVHGAILGPLGAGDIVVGPGGGQNDTNLFLPTAGQALPNDLYIGSGGSNGASSGFGTGIATIAGLNTTGGHHLCRRPYLGQRQYRFIHCYRHRKTRSYRRR